MKHTGIYYLKFYSLVTLMVLILGYTIFQAQKIIRGPAITLSSPLNGATYTTPLIDIKGVAKNVSVLSLNSRPLFPDTNGNFHDRLLLLPGYNIITLEAKDKFNATVTKTVQIIYNEHM